MEVDPAWNVAEPPPDLSIIYDNVEPGDGGDVLTLTLACRQ